MAEPLHGTTPDAVPDDRVAPAWLAVRVTLREPAARAATWRVLRDLDALNVQRGLWAVRAGDAHRQRLQALVGETAAAGGTASVAEVGTTSSQDVLLGARLRRACERLWEDVATKADWYQATAARGGWTVEAQATALADLSATVGSVIGLDLARSDAGRHAEDRVERLADELVAGAGFDVEGWLRARPGPSRTVEPCSSFPLVDGRWCHVARVSPAADPLWALAFRAFEGWAYQPSAGRIPQRLGTFRWVGDPESEAVLVGLEARVETFEASLR